MGQLANKVALSGHRPLIDGCLSAVVDVSDNDTVVHTGAGRLLGYFINTVLSAHVLPIQDDRAIIITLGSAAAISTEFRWIGPPGVGVEYTTSLKVDPNDAASGSITLFYQPYPNTQ